MLFAHDTEVALAAAAALVNTGQGGLEGLANVEALEAFVIEWGWTGRLVGDRAELNAVRALRPRLLQIWTVDVAVAVDIVNALLREAHALPQLVRHDSWSYHLHATPADAPLADRMAVEAAMAITDVIRTGELARLRSCAADNCSAVMVDLSKNRSRRFCDVACANRTNVAAFRARRAHQDG